MIGISSPSRLSRYPFPSQLVVVPDAAADEVDVRDVAHDRVASATCCWNIAYSSAVARRLAQYHVRDPDLADVVEQAGEVDSPLQILVQPQAAGEEHRVSRHVLGMALRVAVLRATAITRPWRMSKLPEATRSSSPTRAT